MDIITISKEFDLPTEPVRYRECKVGHINSTYFLFDSSGRGYVLQQINTNVFKNPNNLMKNVFAVTDHIRNKLSNVGKDPRRGTLRFRKTKKGQLFYVDDEGKSWRIYDYIENAISLQSADIDVFRDVGYAFGNFQMLLSDFDAGSLYETIPDFHNTVKRYNNFINSLSSDFYGRADGAADEIAFVNNHRRICSFITDLLSKEIIPYRVTHNDTKLNNILLDEKSLKPICVIDLDTIMPGSVLFDFGDSIRFGASSVAEDEDDLSKVFIRTDMFESFADGFVLGLDGSLTREELEFLPMGAVVITFETGLRFLTDYLDGDVYFKTDYPYHNLVRARNQFKLVEDLENKMPELKKVINKYY